jgi:pilus assembly protein CpaC
MPQPPSPTSDASSRRPLPEQISAMPSVSETLEVVQHHSQLIIARSKITRSAIADPSIVDVAQYSPQELSVIGLEQGSTTLTVWFEDGSRPLIYLVNTVRDPSVEERRRLNYGRLERKLAILFPNSKVHLIPFSGKVVVKGQAHDVEEAANILQIVRGEVLEEHGSLSASKVPVQPDMANVPPAQAGPKPPDPAGAWIVNMLEVPGEFQVMLRVRIAELDRTQLRSMGVELTHLLFDERHAVPCCGGTSLAGIFDKHEICRVVDALCANGTAKILSEPVLTVLSGHTASFLSGGEFAVPTIVGVEGVGAQQTSFHGFGTSLTVTPTVFDRDLIRLSIVPEFSRLNPSNSVSGIPGVDTRRAQTTVQLREGQTIALAGLISHQSAVETSRVHGWSDIPVIGPRFFAGKRAKVDETELLILVTPEIVRPMDCEEVPPLPGHDVTHPDNCEFFKYGMTEGHPDQGVYEVAPYGAGQCGGVRVGYQLFGGPPNANFAPTPSPQVVPAQPATPSPVAGPQTSATTPGGAIRQTGAVYYRPASPLPTPSIQPAPAAPGQPTANGLAP